MSARVMTRRKNTGGARRPCPAEDDDGGRATAVRPIRLILAARHPLLGRGIARALDRDGSLELVATVESLSHAVLLSERACPDVLLLDSSACSGNAYLEIGAVRARCPKTRVVLLTEPDGDEIDSRLPRIVSTTLLRSIEPAALAAALHRIAGGYAADDLSVHDPEAVTLPQLTPREREVLRGLSQGLTNRQIARRLWLSEHTIKFHVSSIYRKLGVRTRAEAASMLLDGGAVAQDASTGRLVGDLLARRAEPNGRDLRHTR